MFCMKPSIQAAALAPYINMVPGLMHVECKYRQAAGEITGPVEYAKPSGDEIGVGKTQQGT